MGKPKPELYRNGSYTLGTRGDKYVADYVDESRVRRRPSLGRFKTEEEARNRLDQFVAAKTAAEKQIASYTIGDVWNMWLADREEDGFDNTRYNYVWTVLAPTFKNKHPETLAIKETRDYARDRFALGRAPATVNTELRRLKQCLKWAAKRRHIPFEPDVWLPRPGPGKSRVLSFDDAKALVLADVAPHINLFIVLAITTGARHTAILDLTWDRIDFDRGSIDYEIDLPPDPMSRSFLKGRANAPMNAMARLTLTRAHSGRLTGHVVEYKGRRLQSIREGFAVAVKAAQIDTHDSNVTPHTLRHTVTTWTRQGDIGKDRVAALLGHSDTRSTDMYTHVDTVEFARPAADLIDRKLTDDDDAEG